MTLVSFALAMGFLAAPPPPTRFEPVPVSGSDLRLIPESQRSMNRLLISVQAENPITLPVALDPLPESHRKDPRFRRLREQLFGIRFELLHGGIFRAAPSHTRFFVAVPEPGAAITATGEEESFLRKYLRDRVGWTDEVVRRRVHFFHIPEEMNFPRDMAEPLGRDAQDRLVLAIGSDHDPIYFDSLERLVSSFPNDFRRLVLPDVNTEGGDLSLVTLPDGTIGLMVGPRRIRRFVEMRHGPQAPDARIDQARIEEGRAAFRRAFFDREVIILGEEILRTPALASDQVFHADMVVNVMIGRRGPVAFVPSYSEVPVDSIEQIDVPEAIVRRAQGVYDRAALQLQKRGYRVVRISFRDHPFRSPVQAGSFVDPATGRQNVILGKYPYHLDHGRVAGNQQRDLQDVINRMETALAAWRKAPTDGKFATLFASIDAVWKGMDASVSGHNALFDRQAAAYEAEGIRVIGLPIFPTGEGGIHCLLLN